MVIQEPTAEYVAIGVERLLPEAAPVRLLKVLRNGHINVTLLLDSRLGRLVAKTSLGTTRPLVLDRLAEYHRAWEYGLSIPRLLAFSPRSDVVTERALIVFEYLAGQDAEEASRLLPTATMLEVMRRTGAEVARLHQMPVTTFGDPTTGIGGGPNEWKIFVAGRIELLRRVYYDIGYLCKGPIAAGLAMLAQLANEVSPFVRPGVAHLDLYLPNILLDNEGKFQALIDFEHLRWVDPVMDFVKPGMWIFTERPAWGEAFLDGYRKEGGWPKLWSERLAVATGLELLSGIKYWMQVGNHEMEEDYLRRLKKWVSSGGAHHAWPWIVE